MAPEMWRTVQVLKIVLSLSLYGVLAPFGYAGFFLASQLPARDEVARARRYQWAIFRGFRLMHDWLRWVKLIDYQPRAVPIGNLPDQPSVLVANHPSLTDVTILIAAFRNTVTVIRGSTFDRWWLRPLVRAAGQVRTPERAEEVAEMNAEIQRRLGQGFHVLVFPEGQRSHAHRTLRPFSRAPFEAARLAGAPVVPVAIHTRPDWLSKRSGMSAPPRDGMKVTVSVLSEVDSGAFENSRALREEIRDRLDEELARYALESPSADASPTLDL